MGVCEYCNGEMTVVNTCLRVSIKHKGKEYEPIKYGEEANEWENAKCQDCGVVRGGYHHPGCDVERCPVCGEQLISCDCIDDEEGNE